MPGKVVHVMKNVLMMEQQLMLHVSGAETLDVWLGRFLSTHSAEIRHHPAIFWGLWEGGFISNCRCSKSSSGKSQQDICWPGSSLGGVKGGPDALDPRSDVRIPENTQSR